MVNVSNFVNDHIPLCVCTLGTAILGYLGYHAVRWVINKCHKIEKIDLVAQKSIGVASEVHLPSSNNTHSELRQDPLSQSDSNPSVNKVQVDKIALKQESEKQKEFAPTKIQSAYLGNAACLTLKKLQSEKPEEQKSAAAIKIQSIWRGHSARVKAEKARKQLLNYVLLEKAKPYVDIPSNRQNLPRASSGKTPVYLPKELPIVLKQSGSPKNQKRFDQMKQGRDICEKSGYENLVIPQARVYGNFIIESRLPITMHGTKEQIGLYIENREQFTIAVKEFTGFLYQSCYNDITGNYGTDPYCTLSKSPIGRYDNIALYLENGEGKVGLIDLERFSPGCNKLQKNWSFSRCRDAIRLFPYHIDEILSVAKNFDPDIENYRKDIEIERDEVLKRFKLVYEDHLYFIIEKGITIKDPGKFENLELNRKKDIQGLIERELRKLNQNYFKGILGEDSDKTLARFNEKGFPQILDATCAFINTLLEMNLEKAGGKSAITSRVKLLAVRSLHFELSNYLYNNPFEESIEMFVFKDSSVLFSNFQKENLVLTMLDIILKELERGREIAYYNPQFGYGGYAKPCIFC